MDVVGVAIVGGANRYDGLELAGPACCHLEAIEATPGNADHADFAGAPGLLFQPLQDCNRVVLLLLADIRP